MARAGMSRISIVSSESSSMPKHILAVVAIDVDRHGVGRDDGARWRLPCAAEDNQAGVLQR